MAGFAGRTGRFAIAAVTSAAIALTVPPAGTAIVGGAPADRADYPFFVRVGNGTDFCGGSLITPSRVLTAAHCSQLTGIGKRVLVGPEEIVGEVVRFGIHPVGVRVGARQESDAPAAPDLLLLELDEPITELAPVAIAAADEGLTAPGTLATTIGFGASKLVRRRPRGEGTFRSAVVKVQAKADCLPELRGPVIRKWSICTRDPRLPDPGAAPPFASGCFGDSGGPLLADPGDGPRLIGVVSHGSACGTEGDPEIYGDASRAAAYLVSDEPHWAPFAVGAPEVVGRARVGERVRCAVEWVVRPTEVVTYQWLVGRRLPREDGRRFKLRPRDRGSKLRCSASGATKGGFAVTERSAVVVVRGR